MEKYHSSTQPSYKENLQILQSLEKIIFNLNETNINESAESSFSYFFKDFSYSFNFIVCSIAYSFFLVKGLDKVCFEYLKILETVENERIKDNNNKIFTIFAKFLLSINTQESNYLLEKIDNELLYENIEVSQMNEELSKNDWEFHKHLIKEGYNPNEISRIIRNDEIEKLQEISSQNNFDFNQRIEKSIYERCSFLAKENVTLIEYASFFGSIKCFKFLLINGAKLYNSGKFAVASGNLEIIHLCKQNHSKFSDTYVAAIKFHRNDIFHYLYENKFAKISNLENLGIECILSNNYEILSFLQEKRMKISENIINESIKSGNLFLVQYYLEKFPKKSIKFKATSFCGNKELFNYLVNNQFIDTNIKFDNDETSFVLNCAQNGYAEIFKILLEQDGINVNAKCRYGETALMFASENGHTEIVKLLLEQKKIDINAKDDLKRTALILASKNGHAEIVKLLLEQVEIDINAKESFHGETSLICASKNGHIEVVKLLLEQEGIDINDKDDFEQTALIIASDHNHMEIVKLLLEQEGIDVNVKDKWGYTALIYLSSNGHTEMVELILKQEGIDVNAENDKGDTALILASKYGHTEIVKLLLEHNNLS